MCNHHFFTILFQLLRNSIGIFMKINFIFFCLSLDIFFEFVIFTPFLKLSLNAYFYRNNKVKNNNHDKNKHATYLKSDVQLFSRIPVEFKFNRTAVADITINVERLTIYSKNILRSYLFWGIIFLRTEIFPKRRIIRSFIISKNIRKIVSKLFWRKFEDISNAPNHAKPFFISGKYSLPFIFQSLKYLSNLEISPKPISSNCSNWRTKNLVFPKSIWKTMGSLQI